MHNPFTLSIVQNEDFCDREREAEELSRHARNGNNVVLYAPRRYGKSSLAARIQRLLEREGYLTAYIDLFPISSEADVVQRLYAGILKGIGKGADPRSIGEKIKGVFTRIVPSIEVKPDGYGISAAFDRNTKLDFLLDDVMEGVHNYVRNKDLRACIILDEFQEITELPESKKIEGILRSHIQSHKEISYFFVGSRRRILKDMFTNKARPFYKSAFLYTLEKIGKDDFVPYIKGMFERSGKECPEDVAGKIYDAVGGYPYYVQKLSSLVWDATEKLCDEAMIEAAYRLLLKTESPDFEGIWSGLSLTQRSIMRAMAKEPTSSPYSMEYLARYHLSIGGMQKSLKALISKDLIEKDEDGKYRLTDPVMESWLLID